MNAFEKKLIQKIKTQAPYDFPGLKVSVIHRGQKIIDTQFGKTWEYYDIASLTKIVFTTSLFMRLQRERKGIVNRKVSDFLKWYKYPQVTIKQLLSHSAGYEWWRPFYKYIDRNQSPNDKFNQLLRLVRDIPLSHQGQGAIYSDIDFFLLGALAEDLYNCPLIECWNKLQQSYYPNLKFHFNVDNKSRMKKNIYAPTEKCLWRKTVLQGQVHDDNTWALGGVAPHAGLFARMDDMISWGIMLRSSLAGKKSFVDEKVLKQFTKRSLPVGQGDWGLGFMKPSAMGSSAGVYFSPTSFGHTGFTGTSFWFDPQRDLIVNILSNRVHKTRKNRNFISLRPQIHDWVIELIEGAN